jgi:hypothetical protein
MAKIMTTAPTKYTIPFIITSRHEFGLVVDGSRTKRTRKGSLRILGLEGQAEIIFYSTLAFRRRRCAATAR